MSETSGLSAGKVLDKKAHFKAGAIDFTAGSLGKSNNSNFLFVSVGTILFFVIIRWCGVSVREPTIRHGQSEYFFIVKKRKKI